MGFFSRTKKSSPAQAPAKEAAPKIKVTSSMTRTLSSHPSRFYKHAQKDKQGIPHATHMYWNLSPPRLCPEIQWVRFSYEPFYFHKGRLSTCEAW